jgi:hypothetical protein
VLAWHKEKSVVFSVRSAYRLGLDVQNIPQANESSSAPAGDWSLWKGLWSLAVPPKIRIFAWKLSKDILPTKKNKRIRKLEMNARCSLCGDAAEDSFHAVVECPQARSLRSARREHWPLPDEGLLKRTGPDWLLLLLDQCTRRRMI